MSSALYRKYRPQSFSQMIGQNHIKITLQHELAKGEIGHAYLFCGPRGLGKTTSARLFAKSVNCEKRQSGENLPAGQEGEPCNDCPSCLDIAAGRSVDIIEIDAASNTGVENVRDNIIENSRFNPVRSKYKVFILDEVHMLSTPAFNALLKILEEPPEHVIFIMCTTETHKVPLTIISRCQRFDFKKVTGEQMLKRLQLVVAGEEKKVEEEVLKRIVAHSEGCVRDAESLLSKVLSLGNDITADQAEIVLPRSDFESVSAFVDFLAEKNSAAAIEHINRLMEDGVDPVIFAESLLEFLRQMLLIKTSGRLESYGIELSKDLSEGIVALAEKFSWKEIIEMIEVIGAKSKEIKQSAISQLPLEMAVIKLTQDISGRQPEQPVAISTGSARPSVLQPIAALQPDAIALTSIKTPDKSQSEANMEITAVAAAPVAATGEPPSVLENAAESAISTNADSSFSLETVLDKWPVIIQSLVKNNFTLASLLKISQPLKVENGYIIIALTSDFYRGRLESANNRTIIEAAIEAAVGRKVLIKGVVSSSVVPLEMTLDYGDSEAEEQSPAVPISLGDSAAMAMQAIKQNPADEVMNMF